MGVALVAMVDDTIDTDLIDLTNGSLIANDLNQTLDQDVGVRNAGEFTNTSSNQIREPPLLYEESFQTHGILNSMLLTPPVRIYCNDVNYEFYLSINKLSTE